VKKKAAHKYRLAQAQKLIDLGTPKNPIERAKRSMRVTTRSSRVRRPIQSSVENLRGSRKVWLSN
jgi:hypothetical protein